jgi:HEPN domain-containing protein
MEGSSWREPAITFIKCTQLCAFMLYQAIEQFCLANILTHLGINPKTHNLDKLYRLFRFFSFVLVRTFPRDNEREERLFQAIKDSYP